MTTRGSVVFAMLCMLASLTVCAQSVDVLSDTKTYFPPSNMSFEQADKAAVEYAINQMLADKYGTVMGTLSTTSISNTGNGADVTSFEIGEGEVMGEYLGTVGEPDLKHSFVNGMLAITVSIKIRTREMRNNRLDIDAKLLRNGTDDRFESLQFGDMDDLYISFKSPVKGYLAIFLWDYENEVYCLLPYRESGDGAVQVDARKRYLFFSPESDALDCDADEVDRLCLTASKDLENNRIYIIFSPNKFNKPLDSYHSEYMNEQERLISPNTLSFKNFQEWLFKSRKTDRDMNVLKFEITIKK